ncbi:hypothetical protein [Streptomyces lydicamycinicus]|uniref:hypothetical protein n=1 Tax=Streptomyces lydicamycinicus TaxID=1546107 RepID=UPI000B2FC835
MNVCAQLGEEVIFLVTDVGGHLGAQLQYQPVEVAITGLALLEVVAELLNARVVGELFVRQRVLLLRCSRTAG